MNWLQTDGSEILCCHSTSLQIGFFAARLEWAAALIELSPTYKDRTSTLMVYAPRNGGSLFHEYFSVVAEGLAYMRLSNGLNKSMTVNYQDYQDPSI